ncbi:uncharacterized protein EI90DRAFT_3154400 [Cantharellus anzutake]|uniref:uncharacterized protein n=1 Tax=Cantharellus anzutake TaxID=1750568 RepID=UPI001905DD62|nr:uncharacterized protein EI90DRAFT_3154400 [Cantharellus anzutake]KAF8332025.1 hypothetical protein EI90DRAFT_3154400 [Cantharellus anzutake]
MDASSSHLLLPAVQTLKVADETQQLQESVGPRIIIQESVQPDPPRPIIMPVNFGSSNESENNDKAGSSSSRTKQRRVSTSALPTLSNPATSISGSPFNWTFRDEMGITPRTNPTSLQPPRATSERRELVGGIKKLKPRKPVNNDPDANQASTSFALPNPPKRAKRNMWTERETQYLVEGCNIHGVGNWKLILEDPGFEFQDRSPVDLKDRFRVSFPEAYKKYYPNAKTHLSNKTSALALEEPVFERARQNKRRPFSPEEDEALRRGYEEHGTVWSAIAKDPILSSRKSTDLRDRFRNAFPELYAQAGYKPRRKSKKTLSEPSTPAEDPDAPPPILFPALSGRQRQMSEVASRPLLKLSRRAKSHKSVDFSAPCSDTDDSSGEEDNTRQVAPPLTRKNNEQPPEPAKGDQLRENAGTPLLPKVQLPPGLEPNTLDLTSAQLINPLSPPSVTQHLNSPRIPGCVPLPSNSVVSSPSNFITASNVRIGNSPWGPSWLSTNPKLDNQFRDSFMGWPTIPEHGVFDRYDLYSGQAVGHDFASEAGNKPSHSYPHSGGGLPGFSHHHYAGDLISGAGAFEGQDFEYLSTTSGTSHLDVGQLSLQGMDEASEAFGIEDALNIEDDGLFSVSLERPQTAEPGTFGKQSANGSNLAKRPSTATGPSHTFGASQQGGLTTFGRPTTLQMGSTSTSFAPLTQLEGSHLAPASSVTSSPFSLQSSQSTFSNLTSSSSVTSFPLPPTSSISPAALSTIPNHVQQSSFQQSIFSRPTSHTIPTPHITDLLRNPQGSTDNHRLPPTPIDPLLCTIPSSNSPTFNFVEPLSTAALDLHYGLNPSARLSPYSGNPDFSRFFHTELEVSPVPEKGMSLAETDPNIVSSHPTSCDVGSVVEQGSGSGHRHARGQSFNVASTDESNGSTSVGNKRKRASWDGRTA